MRLCRLPLESIPKRQVSVFNVLTLALNELCMRILLVEDEPDVRAFMLRALAIISPQAEIIAAEDGRQALMHFTERKIDLIISDQHMPYLSGLELLQAIRRSSDVPFVLISADSAVAEAAHAAGASCFLAKPFSLNALRQAVEYLAPAA